MPMEFWSVMLNSFKEEWPPPCSGGGHHKRPPGGRTPNAQFLRSHGVVGSLTTVENDVKLAQAINGLLG